MVDIAAIAGVTSSLKAIGDLTKAMIGLRDAEAVLSKSVELNRLALQAFEQALAAREAQAAQVDRIRALETELAEMKKWQADKDRYSLANIGAGVVALRLQENARHPGEPIHCLCPDCAANGKKFHLQPHNDGPAYVTYRCNGCKFEIGIDKASGHRV